MRVECQDTVVATTWYLWTLAYRTDTVGYCVWAFSGILLQEKRRFVSISFCGRRCLCVVENEALLDLLLRGK